MSAPRREVIGDAELWLGDCLALRERIPPNAAIVSDPPYGIAHLQLGSRKSSPAAASFAKSERRNDWRVIGDETPFDPAPWLGFLDTLLWGANHFVDRLPASPGWLVWDKKLGLKEDCFSDGEVAWHRKGRRLRIYRKLWNGLLAREQGERRHHISQKPIDLMRWCLGFVEADVICDPYLGSGTTAIAAMLEGRRFIGFEIDPAHYETALRRIEAAHRQADLFVTRPAPRPKQAALFAEETADADRAPLAGATEAA